MPIDIKIFSESIMSNKPCKHVFLNFKKWGRKLGVRDCSTTPVDVSDMKQKGVIAVWMYTVGELIVEVIYSPSGFRSEFLDRTFHPNGPTNKILIFKDIELE